MAEWIVEFRKHMVFIVTTILLMFVALLTYLCVRGPIEAITWVFAVILISCAWAVYACGQIFSYTARGGDLLLHLSTQKPVKKMLLKILPLITGFEVIGVMTLSGYLWASESDDPLSLVQIISIFGAKVLSVAALLFWSWVLASCVRRINSFGLQIAVYTLGWIISIMIPCIALIGATQASADSWFIGVSDAYNGLPVYVMAIPVIIDDSSVAVPGITLALNAAAILVALAGEVILRKRASCRSQLTA